MICSKMTGLIRVSASDEPNSRWFCIGVLNMYSHMADTQDMSLVCHCRLCALRRLPQVKPPSLSRGTRVSTALDGRQGSPTALASGAATPICDGYTSDEVE